MKRQGVIVTVHKKDDGTLEFLGNYGNIIFARLDKQQSGDFVKWLNTPLEPVYEIENYTLPIYEWEEEEL